MGNTIELPALIKLDMEEGSFRKAIQQNFDHLTGILDRTKRDLDPLVGGGLPNSLEEVVRGMDLEAIDTPIRTVLAEAGVGERDGVAPTVAPSGVQAIGGIGNWFIVKGTGLVNTSPVTYEIHIHTTSGFVPAANTLAGTALLPGGSNLFSFLVRDFPTGHVLDGGINDPVKTGTTYYVMVRAVDGDGPGPFAVQVPVTALTVDANSIIAAGTIVGNLVAANEIVAGHIASIGLTAIQAAVGTLSAITVNAGTLTAGTIRGLTIESSSGTAYVTMSAVLGSRLSFFNAGIAGSIWGAASRVGFSGPNAVDVMEISDNLAEVMGPATLRATGSFQVGIDADIPPANYFTIFKEGVNLKYKHPDGTVKTITAT